jgi:carboxypeptidase Taq
MVIDPYAELCRLEQERATLNSTASLLAWDERTYLPAKGQAFRGEQLALLARMSHERLTAPEIGALVEKAETDNYPADSLEAANIRGIRRIYNRAVKVPTRLVEALARATSAGQNAWETARKNDDFASFRPHLETILKLKREEAQAVGYKDHPYDALLDEFEPGATTSDLKQVFDGLLKELVPFIAAITESGKKAPIEVIERDYPVDAQRALSEKIVQQVGFDREAGRLDVTVHPFCSGIAPGDVRITTRYNPHRFPEAFFGTLHEVGHGLYEQNLPPDQFGLPGGTACSVGIHESQSRLWENLVGRSRTFWEFCWKPTKESFPAALGNVSLDQFYAAINDVRPSFIRIEADEATYNLHIVLRFELEQALLTGDLAAADLPGAWNDRFQQLFGLTVPNNQLGCLQDVHWSAGLIGYFPTYTLGNLYASQFFEQAGKTLGDLAASFRQGEFGSLRGWLIEKIHHQGQRFGAGELCQRVTGRALTSVALLGHLRSKFGALYGV